MMNSAHHHIVIYKEPFHITDTYNIGIATSALPAKIKLKSMKGFHDSTVQLVDIDVEKVFGYK